MGDLFSKYVDAVPMKNQKAETVTDAIWTKWISIHGCPRFILSDQGTNVNGETIKELCGKFNIEKRHSSAYHSQGNGFAERSIRAIREILRTVILDKKLPQKCWRSLLPEVLFALNTSISATTKAIPYKIVFGREPVLPIDVGVDKPYMPTDFVSPEEYINDVKLKLKHAIPVVRNEIERNQAKMQKYYNKSLKMNIYEEGDLVWLRKKHTKQERIRSFPPEEQVRGKL